MALRPDEIQEILRIFADSALEELRLEIGDTRLHVSKKAGALMPPIAPAAVGSAPTAQAASTETAPASPAPLLASQPAATPGQTERPPASGPPGDDNLYTLRSPLLGVFYRRPAPGEPPFVEIGSEVGPEDPVCIVDVMKMFTRVEAGIAGRIADICVEDGQLIEHGQVLMRIEPK